jgi:hypothetical protein
MKVNNHKLIQSKLLTNTRIWNMGRTWRTGACMQSAKQE